MSAEQASWLTLSRLKGWIPAQAGHARDDFARIVEGAANERLDLLLLSALAAQGEPIGQIGAARLQVWRAHMALAARVAAYVADRVGALDILKGPSLQALYPEGWLRVARDVDFAPRDEAAFWQTCRLLQELDCVLLRASFLHVQGRLICAAHWAAPTQFPQDCHRLNFEVAPVLAFGDFVSRAALLASDADELLSAERQLLAILDEAAQRPFCARDAIDAQLVWDGLPADRRPRLMRLCRRLGLEAALVDLCRKAAAMGLPFGATVPQRVPALRSLGAVARSARHPLRALIARHQALPPERGRSVLHRMLARLPATVALAGGSPVYGIALDLPGQPLPEVGIQLYRSGRFNYALCPIGVFALSISRYIDEAFLSDARSQFTIARPVPDV